ncbi:cytochrome P450 2J5-like [Eublepharis macularius]|uniref:Cytochrome P450 2J5-like n=1 Tax=Eublepharis macularius TaxID=481883 RepID=A0AA97JLY4_EUBMA|nr:cytochrome P450 2J5-like [Eublepharis macularius]
MAAISTVFILVLLLYMIIQSVKLQWKKRQFPPGPTALPIIGSLWQLKFIRLHRDTLMEETKTYGDIYTLWFGRFPLIVLNGYQAVKDGLTTHPEDFAGRPITPFFQTLANRTGIMLATGNTWKTQRRFAIMVLKNLGLGKRSLEYKIQEEACHLVENFMNTKGKPMNPSAYLMHAVSNVICAVVFGHRFPSDNQEFHQLLELVERMFRLGGTFWQYLYDFLPQLMHYIPGPHKFVFSGCDTVRSFIRNEIRKHQGRSIPEGPEDFIDYYLAQLEKTKDQPNPAYDEDNMIQSILDLFMGGTETSSTTLSWALLYMVAYPDIQAKVQMEIDAVLTPCQTICYEDRKNLPYTNAVIHEIQRFCNVVSTGMPRLCMKDTMIRQFPVKKGFVIFSNMASSLYDPNEWETPRQFNPSHFLDKDGNFTCREAFIPFSIGHRVCLGEHLARTELFLFFSNLLRQFSFRLPDGVKEINTEPIWGATLQPHHFEICAVPR